eukprot:Pgem_evm1s4621
MKVWTKYAIILHVSLILLPSSYFASPSASQPRVAFISRHPSITTVRYQVDDIGNQVKTAHQEKNTVIPTTNNLNDNFLIEENNSTNGEITLRLDPGTGGKYSSLTKRQVKPTKRTLIANTTKYNNKT